VTPFDVIKRFEFKKCSALPAEEAVRSDSSIIERKGGLCQSAPPAASAPVCRDWRIPACETKMVLLLEMADIFWL